MFRYATSYLAISVLFAANSFGIATEDHVTVNNDNLAKPQTFEKSPGKNRALSEMPFWTQVGQRIKGLQPNTYFGYAVDQSTDGAIIAAGAGDYDLGNATDEGLVKVYKRVTNKKGTKTKWSPMGAIYGEPNDELGFALKLSDDGKILAAGSDDSNDDTGHVIVYKYLSKGKQWKQLGQKLPGRAPNDEAGWGFDLSADGLTIATGVPKYDGFGYNNGLIEVFTYKKNLDQWVMKGKPIPGVLENDSNGTEAYYGWSIGLSATGDRLLASGLFDRNIGGNWTGAVKVWDYDATDDDWGQVGDTIFGGKSGDEFGVSVAMSKDGDTIAVGAGCYYYCDYSDANDDHEDYYEDYVKVYRMESDDWTEIGHIDRREGDIGFGISVSLSNDGERLGLATAGEDYGYARVYQYNSPMDWSQLGQDLMIDDFENGDNGHLVSLSGDGDHLVVGNSDANDETGQATAYELVNEQTKKTPVAGCVDASKKLKFQVGAKKGNCKFVKKKKTDRCALAGVASMCPLTCGKCFEHACADGDLPLVTPKGKEVDCAKVAENPAKLCKTYASVCRATCNTPMYDLLCMDK